MEDQITPEENAPQETEPEQKPTKKSGKLLVILLIIFIALLGIVGSASIWYLKQNEMEKQKSEADTRVAELQSQKNESDEKADSLQTDIDALNKKLKSSSKKKAINSYLYVNNQEGFQLTFPTSWAGYGISVSLEDDKKSKHIYFGLPLSKPDKTYDFGFDRNYANLFAISVMDKATWAASKDDPGGGQKIGEVGDKVYTYSQGNGVTPELSSGSATAAVKDISTIIKSFKIIK